MAKVRKKSKKQKAMDAFRSKPEPPPKPSGISPTDPDFTAKIKAIFEEVKKQGKEKKSTPKDQPHIVKRPRSSTKEKKKARKKARGEPVIEGPTITLKDLAFDHKMDGKEVRRLLRKNHIQKPGGRWEWPVDHDDLDKIKTLIVAKRESK